MNRIRTKICGITRPEDATAAVDAGSDAIGLNFYGKSKRFIAPDFAVPIADLVRKQVALFGVFVNSPPAEVCEIANRVGLSHLQFHGDEEADIVSMIQQELVGAKIVRAVRIIDIDIEKAQLEIDRWQLAGVDMILLDAASLDAFGGTGKQLDWTKLDQLSFNVPWLLAGGLEPHNVAEAVRTAKPDGVDVASGVESSPGIKDHGLIRDFVRAASDTQ